MAGSPTDAADAAIERLRQLRAAARRNRERVRQAVEQVRARNREESLQAMLRVRAARRPGPAWPTARQDRHMHLFDDEDAAEPRPQPSPQPPPPQPGTHRPPQHVDDDDWSNETWLH